MNKDMNLALSHLVRNTSNTTMNWTSNPNATSSLITSLRFSDAPHSFNISTICVLMILCSLAITENIFTCYMIYSNKILHTATNTFVFSLCTTDMLCAGVLVPIAVFYKESIAYQYLAAISVFTYASNLTAVTYERLVSITKPLRYRSIITRQTALRITIAAWAVPVSYCLVPLSWKTNLMGLEHKIYVIIALLVFLVFPLFFICFVYIRILFEVHRLLKESRHLVVYSYDDDSQRASDSLLKRMRKWCSCRRWADERRGVRRKESGVKTSRRTNDDSNEESSYTCKTELYASSHVHESPCLQHSQNKAWRLTPVMAQKKMAEERFNDGQNHGERAQYVQINGKLSPKVAVKKISTNQRKDEEDEGNDKLIQNMVVCQASVRTQGYNRHLEVKTISKDRNDITANVEEDGLKSCCNEIQKNVEEQETGCDEISLVEQQQQQYYNVANNGKDMSEICREDDIAEDEATSKGCMNGQAVAQSKSKWSHISSAYCCIYRNERKDPDNKKTCGNVKVKRRRQRSFRRRQIFDEIKASSAFAGVAFTYMFTWIPVIYMTFMGAIDKQELVPQTMDNLNIWTVAINAAIDPLFYALILRNFRKIIMKKFRRMRNRYR